MTLARGTEPFEPFPPYGEFTADCPARLAVDLFATAWLPVIVYTLRDGPVRPRDLCKRIGGISHKVLTETLRRMESYGLVRHHRYAEAPPRVEYELTAAGRDLLVPIYALGEWAHAHADTVLSAMEESEASTGFRAPRPA
ncbi:winged helix-turn-helix transcriptional regulator [Micromonospora thermarum]|uniref:Helix-turn-helix transcriptional regulator n=1 Tax=Micromonospora thermarum TaxID=2720024 RepID=A0ABX0Z3E4_9ACTN|nr:helix-turn-helix domain-containing protein [Micromonospora thermarum]NJP31657.1 helix-turn-helix transcriptional regulator [Micromonospora thermarum]